MNDEKIPKGVSLIGPIGLEKRTITINNDYWNFSDYQLKMIKRMSFIDRNFIYFFDNGWDTLPNLSKAVKRRKGPYVVCYMSLKGSKAVKIGFSQVLEKLERL